MAWYVDRGSIERIWYPVFPPDRNAETVLAWLRERSRLLSIDHREVRLA
jgi:peroxiredoxin